ncbi:hypothetical protein EV424DRAFT_1553853 [Suillus variegatus]|nr:hypothetical protein EV424DRAFT_1553853 [Suillus variegatus]
MLVRGSHYLTHLMHGLPEHPKILVSFTRASLFMTFIIALAINFAAFLFSSLKSNSLVNSIIPK